MKANEVLRELSISRRTLSRYVKIGIIKVNKLFNGRYEYNDDDVWNIMYTNKKFKRKAFFVKELNKTFNNLKEAEDALEEHIKDYYLIGCEHVPGYGFCYIGMPRVKQECPFSVPGYIIYEK